MTNTITMPRSVVEQRDELLEALNLVLKRGTHVQQSDQYMFEVLNKTRAAIAKAGGEK